MKVALLSWNIGIVNAQTAREKNAKQKIQDINIT